MSDIDVTFGTDADLAAKSINDAAKATQSAEQHSAKLEKTVAALNAKLNATVGAATKAGAALKGMGNAAKFTGTDGVSGRTKQLQDEAKGLVSRRNLMTSIAKQAMADNAAMGESAARGAGASSKHWTKFLSVFGSTGSKIGKAIGMGGGLGAGVAGFVVLQKAIEIATVLLDHHKQKVLDTANAQLFLAHASKQAAEAQGAGGLAAANSQGAGITKLVGAGGGGLELANKVTAMGFSATEAQSAVLAAQNKFGGMGGNSVESAVMAAARASKAGGGSLSEGVGQLDANDLSDGGLAAARLLSVSRGQDNFSVGELQASEARIAGNKTASDVAQIQGVQGQMDLAGQKNIGAGVATARNQLAEAVNPLAKIMLDQYNKEAEQLNVLNKIADSQSNMESFFDRLINRGDSAQMQARRAAGQPLGAVP